MAEERIKTPGAEPGENATSRRSFLFTAGGVAAMLGTGGAGRLLMGSDLLRPPGGQNETSFIAKCVKCDRCRSICPTDVIGVGRIEDGLINAGTPVLHFHAAHCTFCIKCVEVCPTGALEPFNPKSVKIGIAQINDRCIAWNYQGCTVCYKACPYKAIQLDTEKRPVVDKSKCNGCGLCVKVCPALQLRSYIGGNVRGVEVKPLCGGAR